MSSLLSPFIFLYPVKKPMKNRFFVTFHSLPNVKFPNVTNEKKRNSCIVCQAVILFYLSSLPNRKVQKCIEIKVDAHVKIKL